MQDSFAAHLFPFLNIYNLSFTIVDAADFVLSSYLIVFSMNFDLILMSLIANLLSFMMALAPIPQPLDYSIH